MSVLQVFNRLSALDRKSRLLAPDFIDSDCFPLLDIPHS